VGRAETSAHFPEDGLRNSMRVLQDFGVPEPNHLPAQALQKDCTTHVGLNVQVLAAVDLHGELGLSAREIEYVRPDYVLSGEARTKGAENVPELPVRIGGLPTQSTGIRGHAWRDAGHGQLDIAPGTELSRDADGPAAAYPPPTPPCVQGGEAMISTT